ncbi:hypothetical protein [Geosporobacter ferrireducens]|uniref:Uncharacterized protein n=1 Tax=Geosporobacter ferrireducens TaxID=1424294 RepID=A0A1D8GBH0_9FIRM|nr:hypothetical protein [Geosporobacter ferrireducens]AOT68255.1 hypothetical protein Gferi_00830 [Geosporobacter ferrireducens]MTI57324.1 hypothetical protein [Geosporobacter ferrireducens]
MKSLKSIPYYLLVFSIFISTLIAAFHNISFISYIKRSLLFVILIFIASLVISKTLQKSKSTEEAKPTIELTVPAEQITLDYGVENSSEEDYMATEEEGDFAPMDFREYKEKNEE